MKFFVDTADTAEIKSLAASGLVDGVATNPSLVAKIGKKFTDIIREMREASVLREIARNVTITAFLADWSRMGQTIA